MHSGGADMKISKATTVSISERALIQRLNRELQKDGLIIKKTRSQTKSAQELGDYYVVNFNQNSIVDKDLDLSDLEKMGREKKVLHGWEKPVIEQLGLMSKVTEDKVDTAYKQMDQKSFEKWCKENSRPLNDKSKKEYSHLLAQAQVMLASFKS
jgi:hypothetical protein